MSGEKTERPVGLIDGLNTIFRTSVSYFSGHLHVWKNGVLSDDDEWDEIDSYTFSTREAYQISDTIHVRYIPDE